MKCTQMILGPVKREKCIAIANTTSIYSACHNPWIFDVSVRSGWSRFGWGLNSKLLPRATRYCSCKSFSDDHAQHAHYRAQCFIPSWNVQATWLQDASEKTFAETIRSGIVAYALVMKGLYTKLLKYGSSKEFFLNIKMSFTSHFLILQIIK